MNLEDAITMLKQYRAAGASADLTAFFSELEVATLEVDRWDASFVRTVLELLGDDKFHRIPESWKLLYFVHNNWDKLPVEQTDQLRKVLVSSFDTYSDPTGAFTIAEILGEHYCDRATLDIFDRLSKEAMPPANALVPHGLEVFANTTEEPRLRALAITQLQKLTECPSAQVRQEALDSVRKLQRKRCS